MFLQPSLEATPYNLNIAGPVLILGLLTPRTALDSSGLSRRPRAGVPMVITAPVSWVSGLLCSPEVASLCGPPPRAPSPAQSSPELQNVHASSPPGWATDSQRQHSFLQFPGLATEAKERIPVSLLLSITESSQPHLHVAEAPIPFLPHPTLACITPGLPASGSQPPSPPSTRHPGNFLKHDLSISLPSSKNDLLPQGVSYDPVTH